ncbi:MAG: hypothetical protein JO102_01855, partial [Elusimicrobia bacterium]|nr:hypothetical protein [Elusimicrobiota bacterium]
MLKRPSSSLALFISVVLIAQVALAGPAESNFWRDRQNRGARPIQSAPQLAMAVGPAPLLNALPSARAVLGAAPIATLNSGSADVASDLASAVPLGNATVQESFSGHAPAPPVLILQDVHLNNEAQTNLAATLQALFATGRIEKVGVEGAFARFDFSKMRSWPDRKLREAVAHAFLEKNLLAAPSYVGLTSDKEAPPMIGVDDRAGYDANVAAYRRSLGAASKTAAGLANLKEALAAASRTRFSPALAKIDAMRGAYLRGEVPIGRYVQSLAMVGTPGEEVRQFLDAYGLEMSLDFPSVERERRQVLERLTESLSKEELKTLLDRSLAFRMGRVGFGDYYGDLKNLCARRGVNLEQTPSFDRYVRYVILCDRIRPARLLPKVKDLEKDVFSALAKTPEESELVALNERVALMEKLTRFSLSPEEWKEYRDSSGSPAEAASAASRLLGRTVKADVDLSPFEDFYRQADGRSEKIIDNILGGATGPRALVVGGFHTAEIAARLRSREVSYLVVTPKLTKVDESTGSAYLSVFAQEKTPLDR